jgi:hypothetical protein
MTPFETIAIVIAVYGVVFLSHRASKAVERAAERADT